MALNEEQRSLLQLLLGGQGYEDIASLLGTDATQVRERAREALTEVGGADPDAKVGLTDFLLGKADPIGRADAVRQLQNDPDANALASDIVTRLRLLAPNAQLPEIPPAKGGRRAAPTPSTPSTTSDRPTAADAGSAPETPAVSRAGSRSFPGAGQHRRRPQEGRDPGRCGRRADHRDRRRGASFSAAVTTMAAERAPAPQPRATRSW